MKGTVIIIDGATGMQERGLKDLEKKTYNHRCYNGV